MMASRIGMYTRKNAAPCYTTVTVALFDGGGVGGSRCAVGLDACFARKVRDAALLIGMGCGSEVCGGVEKPPALDLLSV